MKKNIKIILIVVGVLIGIVLLDSIQALVFNNNPIIGIQTRGMKKKGILVDTYHCGNGKHDTVIKGFSYSCSKEELNISPEDVNTKIIEYFSKENVDISNRGYNYVDEEKKVVVVGLIDNSKEKQEEFIYNVFSNCCGSKYIKYIKDNSMIEFKKTDPITISNNN